jgi:phosphatidylserine synthase
MPRRGPLTVMGPWAPVAGGLLGLLFGVVVVLFLAHVAETFEDRFALVLTVLALGMLGTSGILLADEVRMIRQRARDAVVRPAWVEAMAGLLNGLTPARLLLAVSTFVLFLAAYVSRG